MINVTRTILFKHSSITATVKKRGVFVDFPIKTGMHREWCNKLDAHTNWAVSVYGVQSLFFSR